MIVHNKIRKGDVYGSIYIKLTENADCSVVKAHQWFLQDRSKGLTVGQVEENTNRV